MVADRFAYVFRNEHREIRDALLGLVRAFESRCPETIGSSLTLVARLAGPHFRYEEEALYPSLAEIFGQDYIDKLFFDHDRAIGSAKRIVALAASDPPADGEIEEAVRLVKGILPHVSDCEGLSLMTETFPSTKMRALMAARDRALRQGLDLLTWSAEVRGRPV